MARAASSAVDGPSVVAGNANSARIRPSSSRENVQSRWTGSTPCSRAALRPRIPAFTPEVSAG